jgi:predicted GNAT family acetyltransferase
MFLVRHNTAATFLARAQSTLELHEAANNLMVGIAIRLRECPERIKTPPYLATVADGERLVAAALMTPPHRLILHAEDADAEALRLLALDLVAGGWHVPGVGALKTPSRAFAETWSAATGQPYRAGMNERVYELRRVDPPDPPISGVLRVATEADLPLMCEWVWRFIQDAGVEGTPEGAREIAETRIADRDLFIWDDGGPVATVTKTRHSTHGIVVSLVYTPPPCRNRGYASAAVAALSQQLLDAGWEFCALFTDLANPTSNSIYQRIGYRPVADFDEYVFG